MVHQLGAWIMLQHGGQRAHMVAVPVLCRRAVAQRAAELTGSVKLAMNRQAELGGLLS